MLKNFISRAFSRFSHGTDPQGVLDSNVKKVEWFQENSYVTMAFYTAKTGKILKRDNSSTYYCYLEDGRIFEKPSRSDQWKEVYPDIKGDLFYNSVLDDIVEEAKQNGMTVEPHPYDVYSRIMEQRRFILWNGTDEQVAQLDETHPIPKRATVTFDTTGCDLDILNPKPEYSADDLSTRAGRSGPRPFY